MNRQTFIAAAAASAAAALPLLSDADETSAAGTTILRPFASAPFPHASRSQGHTYQGKLYAQAASYSDATVGIFIPRGFRPGPATDFIVHFHGWNNDVATVLTRYRLREQVAASNRNAILVVPQGPKDAPDSGDGKLELDPSGFARFMREVASFLQQRGTTPSAQVGRIVLSAHSGGYGGAGGVLTRGGMNESITDVLLFDAAYGYYDAFANWQKATPDHHFLSLFTDDTSTGNTAIMAMIEAPAPNIFVRNADTMTLAQLQTRAPTFALTTTVAHDELLQKLSWYALFLQATALAAR
ncbi:MAG TPA: hypothetical protein VIG51_12590 [Candidatus Baltobacteraceae bacterium]